jgi:glycogen(starch) synthase
MIKHRLQRDRIREFMLYYFFPYYTFDLKQTLVYFIAGRYEFRDKGIDVYIKALGKLNEKLKKSNSQKTIISFIWVPANFRNVKTELLENKTFYQDIKDALDETKDDVEKDIVYSFVSGSSISKDSLFDEGFLREMKIRVSRFVKKGTPPLCTHDLYDENDIIIKSAREAGLSNTKEDKVKIIYYPIYLSGADGILNLNYYEAMQGSHLGIFPSYYEPWGYTPLESSALGVSSVTTDVAGFGRYICNDCKQNEESGIFVLKRMGKSEDEAVNQLAETMHTFAELPREERVANKQQARKLASTCDWKNFIKNYIEAHNLACGKIHK